MANGNLYIVATPIGNLQDFSFRAVDILQKVDLIACEDTRVTQKLLNHFGINKKTISYHKFSEKEKSSGLIKFLKNGQNIALVSDAGTPLISDPGSILVKNARKENIKVVPIPGCNAVITALSAIENDGTFAFLGFFPQKKSEIKEKLKYNKDFNLVFYESPNRIIKTLYLIQEILGNVKISIARELTKIYEDIKTFEILEMITYLENSTVKGEIVFVVHKQCTENNSDVSLYISKLLNAGYTSKDIVQIISTVFNIPKNEVKKSLTK